MRKPRYDYYLYLDESGEPGKDDYFIIGILFVSVESVRCIRRMMRNVRSAIGFWDEFHWSCFSRKRANAYRALIHASIQCDWRYECIIVPKNEIDLSFFKSSIEPNSVGRFRAYNKFTRMLLENRMEHFPGPSILIADKKDRMSIDNFAYYLPRQIEKKALIRKSPARILRVVERDSKQVAGLQMVDIITGMIATDRKRGFRPPQTSKELLARQLLSLRGFEQRLGTWLWFPYPR